jgi:hypothetical protein
VRGREDRACVAARKGWWAEAEAGVRAPSKEKGGPDAAAGYLAPLRQAPIDRNHGHVNVVVCESDYSALKRGIENLGPGVQ